jgi:hypothetical protein
MDRIDALRASDNGERADPADETVINGAPYDAHKAIRSGPENPATPADRSDAHIADDIKRRQISLAVRYITAARSAPFTTKAG